MRRLIDEAAEHLHLRLPIYLVVTGLEKLTGYDTLRSSLSKDVLTQVIGYRWTGIAELVPEVARSARPLEVRDNTPADYDAMSDDFDHAQPTAWKDGDEL